MSALPLAIALSTAIALGAWRAGSLSRSGGIAAVFVGALCMTAGTAWGVFLVLWFVMASVASKAGRSAKQLATGDVVAKGGPRDALQVLANGGVYATAAFVSLWRPDVAPLAAAVGAAALVAAGADTLATETGTLWRGQPWSLRSFGQVPPGSSGAVSLAGSAGMVVGALVLAWSAALIGLIPTPTVGPVAAAGVAGAVADTLIGAWWQARRWCPNCERETEQPIHRCGTPTRPWRGVPWLGNDMVNFACTLVAASLMWGLH